jgi:hypothetical protein
MKARVFSNGQLIADFTFVSDAVRVFSSLNCWIGVTHIDVPLDAWATYLKCGGIEHSADFNSKKVGLVMRMTLKEAKR